MGEAERREFEEERELPIGWRNLLQGSAMTVIFSFRRDEDEDVICREEVIEGRDGELKVEIGIREGMRVDKRGREVRD